jgi:hypothetical protein
MHRRIPGRRYPYARPTHWLAAVGSGDGPGEKTAWGRTQREAMANLKTALGLIEDDRGLNQARSEILHHLQAFIDGRTKVQASI